jgi:ATP-dependent DNA helicase RecG
MNFDSSVESIKGVGPALAAKFAQVKVRTVQQLIDYYPRRYDDYSQVIPVAEIRPGAVTIAAAIHDAKGRYVRRGMHITEATATDESGSVKLVWFNQPYRAAALKDEAIYYVSGLFDIHAGRPSIQNPSVELEQAFPVNTARIVPIYRETKGLGSLQIRKALREVIPAIRATPEQLPQEIVEKYQLMGYADALEQLHFPASGEEFTRAKRRLSFQEVFELITASLLNKYEIAREPAPRIPFRKETAQEFTKALPYELTDAQRRTIWQIFQDMEREYPMNRLVEGDVGAGKTVVAAMAAHMAAKAGYVTALMAPTEILARQHAETLSKILEPLGRSGEVGLLVGSMNKAAKERARKALTNGHTTLVTGTHALIQDSVAIEKLGLIVVDEQHRFGVEQRKELQRKSGLVPHVLSLTATPIPRSLALTLYGELDVSILDTKPPGRQPVITKICSPNSRAQLYEEIDKELQDGRQMFVVCPLIEDSDGLKATSVATAFKEMQKAFKGRSVEMLHGKMSADDKQTIMERFASGATTILVSTTVIEVGVDVPNASIMLLESAERFGLAQAHQLRGRVGRGGHKGYCYLMLSDSKPPSKRLRALETSNDGFRLAELDLELRGPGAIYGSMQHGEIDLRIAQLSDTRLLAEARQAADAFVAEPARLVEYEQLAVRIARLRKVTNLN